MYEGGWHENFRGYTVYFHKDQLKFVKDYAYTKRITVTEAMNEIISKFEADYYADASNEQLLSKDKR